MEKSTNSTKRANPSTANRVTSRILEQTNRYHCRSSFINFEESLEPTPSRDDGTAFPSEGTSLNQGERG